MFQVAFEVFYSLQAFASVGSKLPYSLSVSKYMPCHVTMPHAMSPCSAKAREHNKEEVRVYMQTRQLRCARTNFYVYVHPRFHHVRGWHYASS